MVFLPLDLFFSQQNKNKWNPRWGFLARAGGGKVLRMKLVFANS